jgi:hypothetical protein
MSPAIDLLGGIVPPFRVNSYEDSYEFEKLILRKSLLTP